MPETGDLRELWNDARRGIHLTGSVVSAAAELIRSALSCGGIGRLVRLPKCGSISPAAS